jgi:hypothetical protein
VRSEGAKAYKNIAGRTHTEHNIHAPNHNPLIRPNGKATACGSRPDPQNFATCLLFLSIYRFIILGEPHPNRAHSGDRVGNIKGVYTEEVSFYTPRPREREDKLFFNSERVPSRAARRRLNPPTMEINCAARPRSIKHFPRSANFAPRKVSLLFESIL